MSKLSRVQKSLLLRYMNAFVKSDDEKDFYLNKAEGFIISKKKK